MLLAEPALERREVERGELDAVELDRDLEALAAVAHVEDEADVLVGDVDALGVEPVARAGGQRLERLADGVRRRGRDALHERLAELVLDLRGDEAERREHAGLLRHDHRVAAEDRRQRVRVQAARTAEGDERELARHPAALHGDDAERAEHRLVDHAHDRARGLLDAGAAHLGDARDGAYAASRVELELAAEQPRRQVAEDDVRVGDRGRRPAAAVAGRAGNRAGALRADPERPGRLGDVGDRAAAGADARHVDRRARAPGSRRRSSRA